MGAEDILFMTMHIPPKAFKRVMEISSVVGFTLYPQNPEEMPVEVDQYFILKHRPVGGGYLVTTNEDEQTYCPRDFFHCLVDPDKIH